MPLRLVRRPSGNPLSPHFDDLFHLRERGDAAKLAWTPEQVLKAAKHTLRLTPAPPAGA